MLVVILKKHDRCFEWSVDIMYERLERMFLSLRYFNQFTNKTKPITYEFDNYSANLKLK